MVAHVGGHGLGAGGLLFGGGGVAAGQVCPGKGDAAVGFVNAVAAVGGVAEGFAQVGEGLLEGGET